MMTPERIAKLRTRSSPNWDEDRESQLDECLDEIERLQSDLAAIRQTCAEVASELRRCPVDSPNGYRDMAQRLEAAAHVPTTPRPLSGAPLQSAKAAAAQIPAEPLPFPVIATDPADDALVDGMLARARAKQPERCNASLDGWHCEDDGGHSPDTAHHYDVFPDRIQLWNDDRPGAKPHVPAAGLSKCTCAGTAEESKQCRVHAYGERDTVDPAWRLQLENVRLTKERDEALAELAKAITRYEGAEKREKQYAHEIDRMQVELHEALEPSMSRQRTIVDLRAENEQLRTQLASLKAEMLRLVDSSEIDALKSALREFADYATNDKIRDWSDVRRRVAHLLEVNGVKL